MTRDRTRLQPASGAQYPLKVCAMLASPPSRTCAAVNAQTARRETSAVRARNAALYQAKLRERREELEVSQVAEAQKEQREAERQRARAGLSATGIGGGTKSGGADGGGALAATLGLPVGSKQERLKSMKISQQVSSIMLVHQKEGNDAQVRPAQLTPPLPPPPRRQSPALHVWGCTPPWPWPAVNGSHVDSPIEPPGHCCASAVNGSHVDSPLEPSILNGVHADSSFEPRGLCCAPQVTDFDDAFKKLARAAGSDEPDVVIHKFVGRHESSQLLTAESEEMRAKSVALSTELNRLLDQLTEMQYAADGPAQTEAALRQLDPRLTAAGSRLNRLEEQVAKLRQLQLATASGCSALLARVAATAPGLGAAPTELVGALGSGSGDAPSHDSGERGSAPDRADGESGSPATHPTFDEQLLGLFRLAEVRLPAGSPCTRFAHGHRLARGRRMNAHAPDARAHSHVHRTYVK